MRDGRLKRRRRGGAASGRSIEQRRAARLRPLDRQQAQLGAHAAGRGKSAGLAAGRQHAVARHDDRERILPKRLRDVARQTAIAQPLGDLAIGQRRAGAEWCARYRRPGD